MQKPRTTEAKIEQLRDIIEHNSADIAREALQKALKDKSNFVVAKAGEWTGQGLHYDLIPDLVKAYQRFLAKPLQHDKTCAAKRAIVRALYELDYDDAKFYRDGMHYIQLEPVYGGHVDTAVEVRCSCAFGLVSTPAPRVILDLIELLYDEESQVRSCAAKALELVQPFDGEIALRQKILQDDPEPEVIAQAFSSLIKLAPEDSFEFIVKFLQDDKETTRQGAALALGESRLNAALDVLIEESESLSPFDPLQKSLLRAIALHRNEKAFDFLLAKINNENTNFACDVIEVLSMYSFNEDLRNKVSQLVEALDIAKVSQAFEEYWAEN